ncbi:MAG: hypothetical protein BA066_02630 [Candidatus Korarchaeota archaeon NZ13-K]|nr:MAG: hypothetical protein BA066_02630 [Candidatus Korarchaeota archaeon NZ13-K]
MIPRVLMLALLSLAIIPIIAAEAQNPFSWMEDSIKGLTDAVIELLNMLRSSALTIGRILAGTLIALGIVLWGSDIFSYKGRRLVLTGIILIIVMEMLA